MDKISRNQPCPCGSGKKYKNCCLIQKRQTDALPWRVFPEDIVIGNLLKSCSEFATFYEVERNKIVMPFRWAKDSSLPEGIDYRCTMTPNGIYVIRLRRVPAVPADAMKIAHELEHLVLRSEGFVSTGAKSQYATISSSLNSMIHDPLVDSRLATYGFDLRAEYKTELKESFRQLTSHENSPSGHLSRVLWIFNYVAKMLDWELRYVDTKEDDNEFKLRFDKRYPDIAKEGMDLLKFVKEVGYDTPDKQVKLFRKIIRKYKLDGVVFL